MDRVFVLTGCDYDFVADEDRSELVEYVLTPGTVHRTLESATAAIQEEIDGLIEEYNADCVEDIGEEPMDPPKVFLVIKEPGEWEMHLEEFSTIYKIYEREVR